MTLLNRKCTLLTSFEIAVWTNTNLLQSHLHFLAVLSILCLLNVTSLSRSKVDNIFCQVVALIVTVQTAA